MGTESSWLTGSRGSGLAAFAPRPPPAPVVEQRRAPARSVRRDPRRPNALRWGREGSWLTGSRRRSLALAARPPPAAQQPQCPTTRGTPHPPPPTVTTRPDHTTASRHPPESRPASRHARDGVRLTGSQRRSLALAARPPGRARPHAGLPRRRARRRRSDGRRSARRRRRGAEAVAGGRQGSVRRHGNECRTTSGAQQPQCPMRGTPHPPPPTVTTRPGHTTESRHPPESRPASRHARDGVRLTGSRRRSLALAARPPGRARPHAGMPRRRHGGGGATGVVRHVDGGVAPKRWPGTAGQRPATRQRVPNDVRCAAAAVPTTRGTPHPSTPQSPPARITRQRVGTRPSPVRRVATHGRAFGPLGFETGLRLSSTSGGGGRSAHWVSRRDSVPPQPAAGAAGQASRWWHSRLVHIRLSGVRRARRASGSTGSGRPISLTV